MMGKDQKALTIGEHIRSKREERKVSQFAVAFSLDISQAAYSKIERGETEIKVSQLYKIAQFLNISVYELMPAAMASDVFGDYLLAPIVHKILTWWYKKSAK